MARYKPKRSRKFNVVKWLKFLAILVALGVVFLRMNEAQHYKTLYLTQVGESLQQDEDIDTAQNMISAMGAEIVNLRSAANRLNDENANLRAQNWLNSFETAFNQSHRIQLHGNSVVVVNSLIQNDISLEWPDVGAGLYWIELYDHSNGRLHKLYVSDYACHSFCSVEIDLPLGDFEWFITPNIEGVWATTRTGAFRLRFELR